MLDAIGAVALVIAAFAVLVIVPLVKSAFRGSHRR